MIIRRASLETLNEATVSRFCGSSMKIVYFATGKMLPSAWEADVIAGFESRTSVPMDGLTPSPNPILLQQFLDVYSSKGNAGKEAACRYDVSREDQGALAVLSDSKAAKAREDGQLAGLKPASGGIVTSGASPPLAESCAASLVCTEDLACRYNLRTLGRFKVDAVDCCAPEFKDMGPLEAARKVLDRNCLSINDADLMKINEMFFSQLLACLCELFNLNGGALGAGTHAQRDRGVATLLEAILSQKGMPIVIRTELRREQTRREKT